MIEADKKIIIVQELDVCSLARLHKKIHNVAMSEEMSVLLVSIGYVFCVILFGLIAYKREIIGSELARKLIHIGVSNWVFFWYFGLDTFLYSIIGPVAFIFCNALFVFTSFRSVLGLNDPKRDMGLVYFPISLSVLIALSNFGYVSRIVVLGSIMAMGYGDGFSALIGKKWGRHKYTVLKSQKTIEGSVIMLLIVFFIAAFTLNLPFHLLLLVALIVTAFEAAVGCGLDNLFVPLSFALLGTVL